MTHPDKPAPVRELSPDAGGLWVVRSASQTCYYLDLDAWLLLRAPGPGSHAGPYDGVWVPLVGIVAQDPEDLDVSAAGIEPITVGHRHLYQLDPRPGDPVCPARWWLQREVTSIQAVPADQRPAGRAPNPDEDSYPYR